jgi:TRAP-type C4-dicarboxylate transport system substrate-binding protein
MRRLARPAVALACLAYLVAACTANGAVKSGGPLPPTVLVLANNDTAGLDGAPAVQQFVDQVTAVSAGRLVIKVHSSWGGGNDEAKLVKDVSAGRADLGWAGTRAFDILGVDSLRPLSVPFLVDSYPLEAAVVRNGQRRLLADIAHAGVTPLALDADALRFPAAVAGPLRALNDWAGKSIRTLPSRVQETALSVLGAVAVSGGDLTNGLESGAIDGAEVSWQGYVIGHVVDQAKYVTPNAVLWPRALVVFANPKSVSGLSSRERLWLSAAARASSRWSTVHAGDKDTTFAQRACRLGARIATATPSQLRDLSRATLPIYDQLRRDPQTASTLNWVMALKKRIPRSSVGTMPAGCAYRSGRAEHQPSMTPLAAPGPTDPLPRGTYRYTLSATYLSHHHVVARDADASAGVYTWTLGNGVFHLSQPTDSNQPGYPCAGYFAVSGAKARFTRTVNQPYGDCVPPNWSASWTYHHGYLTWSGLIGYRSAYNDFAPWFTQIPWKKIR